MPPTFKVRTEWKRLSLLPVGQLRAECLEKGLDTSSCTDKEDLIRILHEHQSPKEPPQEAATDMGDIERWQAMTMPQLRQLCRREGVDIAGAFNKDGIIQRLELANASTQRSAVRSVRPSSQRPAEMITPMTRRRRASVQDYASTSMPSESPAEEISSGSQPSRARARQPELAKQENFTVSGGSQPGRARSPKPELTKQQEIDTTSTAPAAAHSAGVGDGLLSYLSLLDAVVAGDPQAVQRQFMLLSAGSWNGRRASEKVVQQQDDLGYSVMHWLSFGPFTAGSSHIARLLVKEKADIRQCSVQGDTPLSLAVETASSIRDDSHDAAVSMKDACHFIEVLIRCNADPFAHNGRGKTAVQQAADCPEVLNLLRLHTDVQQQRQQLEERTRAAAAEQTVQQQGQHLEERTGATAAEQTDQQPEERSGAAAAEQTVQQQGQQLEERTGATAAEQSVQQEGQHLEEHNGAKASEQNVQKRQQPLQSSAKAEEAQAAVEEKEKKASEEKKAAEAAAKKAAEDAAAAEALEEQKAAEAAAKKAAEEAAATEALEEQKAAEAAAKKAAEEAAAAEALEEKKAAEAAAKKAAEEAAATEALEEKKAVEAAAKKADEEAAAAEAKKKAEYFVEAKKKAKRKAAEAAAKKAAEEAAAAEAKKKAEEEAAEAKKQAEEEAAKAAEDIKLEENIPSLVDLLAELDEEEEIPSYADFLADLDTKGQEASEETTWQNEFPSCDDLLAGLDRDIEEHNAVGEAAHSSLAPQDEPSEDRSAWIKEVPSYKNLLADLDEEESLDEKKADSKRPAVTEGDLDRMTMRQLRQECEVRKVDINGCMNKVAVIERLQEHVQIPATLQADAADILQEAGRKHDGDTNAVVATPCHNRDASAAVATPCKLSTKSVRDLRQECQQRGIDLAGCSGKIDLMNRLQASLQTESVSRLDANQANALTKSSEESEALQSPVCQDSMTTWQSMTMRALRKECELRQIDITQCCHKEDVISALCEHQQLSTAQVRLSHQEGTRDLNEPPASTNSAEPPSPSGPASGERDSHEPSADSQCCQEEHYMNMPPGRLCEVCKLKGINLSGCLDKEDMIERLLEGQPLTSLTSSQNEASEDPAWQNDFPSCDDLLAGLDRDIEEHEAVGEAAHSSRAPQDEPSEADNSALNSDTDDSTAWESMSGRALKRECKSRGIDITSSSCKVKMIEKLRAHSRRAEPDKMQSTENSHAPVVYHLLENDSTEEAACERTDSDMREHWQSMPFERLIEECSKMGLSDQDFSFCYDKTDIIDRMCEVAQDASGAADIGESCKLSPDTDWWYDDKAEVSQPIERPEGLGVEDMSMIELRQECVRVGISCAGCYHKNQIVDLLHRLAATATATAIHKERITAGTEADEVRFDELEAEAAEEERIAAEKQLKERRLAAESAAREAEEERIAVEKKAEGDRLAAEIAARAAEEERIAVEKKAEEERLAAEAEARAAEEKRIAVEKKAEEERLVAEALARAAEEERIAAVKKVEEERLAAEAAARAAEEERIAAEEKAEEEERLAAEAAARAAEEELIAAEKKAEEERLAAEALARAAEEERIAAVKKAEEERLSAEALARAAEEERIAAEKKAEEERLAAEALARAAEKERIAAEKKVEEERLAADAAARAAEEERIAAEKKAEEERLAAEALAEEERIAAEKKAEEERLAAEAAARAAEEERIAAVKKAEEERLAAEALARAAEEERIAVEKKEEEERLAAEALARAAEEKRIAAEKKAAEERLAAEAAARAAEEERIAAEKKAEEEERLAAEDAARAAEEEELIAAQKKAEEERLAAEALARAAEEERIAAVKKVEEERLAAQAAARAAEEERIAAEKKAEEEERLAAEAAARAAEEEELIAAQKKAEEERLAAEALARAAEEERIAAGKKAEEEGGRKCFETMPIRDLKRECASRGVNVKGCIDRDEIIKRLYASEPPVSESAGDAPDASLKPAASDDPPAAAAPLRQTAPEAEAHVPAAATKSKAPPLAPAERECETFWEGEVPTPAATKSKAPPPAPAAPESEAPWEARLPSPAAAKSKAPPPAPAPEAEAQTPTAGVPKSDSCASTSTAQESEAQASPASSSSAATYSDKAPPPATDKSATAEEELKKHSVKVLLQMAKDRNVETTGCVEKAEIVERLLKPAMYKAKPAPSPKKVHGVSAKKTPSKQGVAKASPAVPKTTLPKSAVGKPASSAPSASVESSPAGSSRSSPAGSRRPSTTSKSTARFPGMDKKTASNETEDYPDRQSSSGWSQRIARYFESHPGFSASLPPEAETWTDQDLSVYFGSNGEIWPKGKKPSWWRDKKSTPDSGGYLPTKPKTYPDLKEHFLTLDLPETTPHDVIKRTYRRMARDNHPDKNPDDVEAATQRFQEITTAYEAISQRLKIT